MAQFAAELGVEADIASMEQFKQLQSQFPQEHPYTIERFLIARNYNVEKATLMLQNHIEWRAANLPVSREEVLTEGQRGILMIKGKSKLGYQIMTARGRMQRPKERNLEEMLRGGIYLVEKALDEFGDKRDTPEAKFVLVFDRTNSDRSHVDTEFWKQMAHIVQDNYPERLDKILVYPANILFRSIWAVFKWFIDAKTRNKLVMLGNESQLQGYIDRSQLLRNLGGKLDDTFNIDRDL